MSFEESLIRNAAPTLAGIKVANLFNFHFENDEDCKKNLDSVNEAIGHKGIRVELLKAENNFYLIYVYRNAMLSKEINKIEIKKFLNNYGYLNFENTFSVLERLKKRLSSVENFPHEIGVFLGYPLDDVKSFIEKKGRDYIACGEWKVYHDEQSAMCLFGKMKHCKDIYIRVYGNGSNLYDLTVST